MFLLVSSAHAVECQEKIPSSEHRVMLRNLFDTYLCPETGKSTGERPNNNFCQEVYGAKIR
jgi:hypothetical protein